MHVEVVREGGALGVLGSVAAAPGRGLGEGAVVKTVQLIGVVGVLVVALEEVVEAE